MEVIESICNKARIEQKKSTGLFILTGSQDFQMMRGVSQSLAGRATIINMSPLSVNEIRGVEEKPFKVNMETMKKKFIYRSIDELFKEIHRDTFQNFIIEEIILLRNIILIICIPILTEMCLK